MIYDYCKNLVNSYVRDICNFLKSTSFVNEFDFFGKPHKDCNKDEEHNLLDEVYVDVKMDTFHI